MKAYLEPHLPWAGQLLNSKKLRLSAFDHPFHFHPEIEFTFISASAGTCVAGDHVGVFEPGELYLLGSNLPHVFRNTVQPETEAAAEVLHFPQRLFDGWSETPTELRGSVHLMELAERGLLFDRETSAQGARMLRRIRKAEGARRLAAFFELLGILLAAPSPRILAGVGVKPETNKSPDFKSCWFVGNSKAGRGIGNHVSLHEFLDRFHGLGAAAVGEDVEKVKAMGLPARASGDDDLAVQSRFYLALRELAQEESLDALALRCWSELSNLTGRWPYQTSLNDLDKRGGGASRIPPNRAVS